MGLGHASHACLPQLLEDPPEERGLQKEGAVENQLGCCYVQAKGIHEEGRNSVYEHLVCTGHAPQERTMTPLAKKAPLA